MRLSTNLADANSVPYFLWDEPITTGELRARLGGADLDERVRLETKVLREARFDEAVSLVPVARIVEDWERIRPRLGRRRAFWEYLLAEWRTLGLLP